VSSAADIFHCCSSTFQTSCCSALHSAADAVPATVQSNNTAVAVATIRVNPAARYPAYGIPGSSVTGSIRRTSSMMHAAETTCMSATAMNTGS